jgi:hypothetical protein
MASLDMITIRYRDCDLDDENEPTMEMTAPRNEICSMSQFIDDMLESTQANMIDFTIAAEGQEPLSPNVVNSDILHLVCREYCPYPDLPLPIFLNANYVTRLNVLAPKPRLWEQLDRIISSSLSFGKFQIWQQRYLTTLAWDNENHADSAMDALVEFMTALSPYMTHLPRTVNQFKHMCLKNFEHVDFKFEKDDVIKGLLTDLVVEIVQDNMNASSIKPCYRNGVPLKFRTRRLSTAPEEGAPIRLEFRIHIILGSNVVFGLRKYA